MADRVVCAQSRSAVSPSASLCLSVAIFGQGGIGRLIAQEGTAREGSKGERDGPAEASSGGMGSLFPWASTR